MSRPHMVITTLSLPPVQLFLAREYAVNTAITAAAPPAEYRDMVYSQEPFYFNSGRPAANPPSDAEGLLKELSSLSGKAGIGIATDRVRVCIGPAYRWDDVNDTIVQAIANHLGWQVQDIELEYKTLPAWRQRPPLRMGASRLR